MVAFALACACATGEGDDGPLGVSFAPGEDDGDDDAATKGGSGVGDDDESSSDGDGETTAAGDEDGESSGTDGGPAPLESSDGALESSDGAPPPLDDDDDDGGDPPPPTGDPMYSPCNADDDCADGVCLVVQDEYENQLSAFCSGPCAFPQQDCDPAPDGDTTPACIIAERGQSICTLDCAGGAECPNGMQCATFPGELQRCI